MRESQFDELCGLRQIAVSWAIRSVRLIQLWDLLGGVFASSNDKALPTPMYFICSAFYHWYVGESLKEGLSINMAGSHLFLS
jgi:hypothetical protein